MAPNQTLLQNQTIQLVLINNQFMSQAALNNYFFVLYQSMLNFNNQISSDNKVTFLAKRAVHVYAVYYYKQLTEDFEKCS